MPQLSTVMRGGGENALMVCSMLGSTESVSRLLHFIDPNASDHRGWTPLMFACFNGHLDVVKRLLPKASIHLHNNTGQTALDLALENNHLSIVRYLEQYQTALFEQTVFEHELALARSINTHELRI